MRVVVIAPSRSPALYWTIATRANGYQLGPCRALSRAPSRSPRAAWSSTNLPYRSCENFSGDATSDARTSRPRRSNSLPSTGMVRAESVVRCAVRDDVCTDPVMPKMAAATQRIRTPIGHIVTIWACFEERAWAT